MLNPEDIMLRERRQPQSTRLHGSIFKKYPEEANLLAQSRVEWLPGSGWEEMGVTANGHGVALKLIKRL